ncbi:hypothetical protein GCM10020254_27240 [Streptomyces goshikiensis]
MQAGRGAVGALGEDRDHLARRHLLALRDQWPDRLVRRPQPARKGQGEDPAPRHRPGEVHPPRAYRADLRAHRGRQVHAAVPGRVRPRRRVPPPDHGQRRGQGAHPRGGGQGQEQAEQQCRHAPQRPRRPPRPARACGRTGRCGQVRHPAYRRVPYTSCGDPGHRVDFARPSSGRSGRVPAPLGPLFGGQGATGRQEPNRENKEMAMAVVTMRELLESGVHFGHQTRRWNPKMKRFIFTERNGIYIIDLLQSLSYIDRAYEFVKETVAHGGSIMFVGTKKQAQEAIAEQATRVGMPYVNQRWLGGMLTNFSTVYKRLQRLKELEAIDFEDVAASGLTKKELLVLSREKIKLEKTLGGIREMSKVPSAVWIVDTKKEHIAVGEARKLHIPVVAILDTNCDPDEVDYKIPGNDDAIRSVTLLTRVIADAVAEGLIARSGAATGDSKPGEKAAAEPLAEWERDLLEGEKKADDAEAPRGRRRRRGPRR